MRPIAPILLLALALGACNESKSERCRAVCKQETYCAEQRSQKNEPLPYDLDECIAACVALERDSEGKQLVEQHIQCAKKAGEDCAALMLCR